eukprot:721101-Amphidinium_carterae.1
MSWPTPKKEPTARSDTLQSIKVVGSSSSGKLRDGGWPHKASNGIIERSKRQFPTLHLKVSLNARKLNIDAA